MKKLKRKSLIGLFITLIMILNLMPFGLISEVYADGEIKIDSIRISGITTPTAGAMPVFSCVIPTGEHYSLFYTGVQWLDISDSSTMNTRGECLPLMSTIWITSIILRTSSR